MTWIDIKEMLMDAYDPGDLIEAIYSLDPEFDVYEKLHNYLMDSPDTLYELLWLQHRDEFLDEQDIP